MTITCVGLFLTLSQHFRPICNHGKSVSLQSNEAVVPSRMGYTDHKTSSNELWEHLIFKGRQITLIIGGLTELRMWFPDIFLLLTFSTPVNSDRFDTRQVI